MCPHALNFLLKIITPLCKCAGIASFELLQFSEVIGEGFLAELRLADISSLGVNTTTCLPLPEDIVYLYYRSA